MKTLTFVINVPSFFVSHRLPIARAAQKRGWKINLIAGMESDREKQAYYEGLLREADIIYLPARFRAAGKNPFAELRGLLNVISHVLHSKSDIVHTASPKGNLYGGIAARLCGIKKLVIAVSGQGYLFTGQALGVKRLLAQMYQALIRWVYKHPNCTVIVQNKDDLRALYDTGLVAETNLILIPGSGVDIHRYASVKPAHEQDIVILPARLLADKGVLEFVDACGELKKIGVDWRFVLVGEADCENPTAITSLQINQWVSKGTIEWWGHRDDMVEVFSQAAIVCLPSYREGMPKVLLEAAACGKAIVTTDAIGCREAIIEGQTGLLVPVKNSQALKNALFTLINNSQLRAEFGMNARKLAVDKFDIQRVIEKTLLLYE